MRRMIFLSLVISVCVCLICACFQTKPSQKVKAVIVPHDVVASKLAEDIIKSLAGSNPKTIFLLGPNHTANGPKITSSQKLSSLIGNNAELIENEHSIGNLMPMLKRHLPNAKIIPIIFQKGVSFDAAKKVMDTIVLEPNAIMIASIDFSHGLSVNAERVNRMKIEEYIKRFDSSSIMSLDGSYLDAPVLLATMLEALKGCKIDTVASTNSSEVLRQETQNTTGYLTMVFYE